MDNILRFSEDGKTLVKVVDKSVTSITIPDGVTTIGDAAFSECSKLKSVILPDSLTSIGNGVFSQCIKLQSVTIPDSVTMIGDDPFNGCSSLEFIEVGDGNLSFSSEDGILFNKLRTALVRFPAGKPYLEYTIPNGVTDRG